MNSYLKRQLMRSLTPLEVQLLEKAGELSFYKNHVNELPYMESMKTFVMLCWYNGFSNENAFWKEYRLLSEMLADTSKYYIHTPIPKRNGKGYRHIYKVDEDLAFYQRQVKHFILDVLDARFTSGYAYAYRRHRSVADNAKAHAGHEYLVKMDIKDFFDNTKQSKVFEIFSKYTEYNKEVKTMLTKLVCHDGHLNQGSCTSPQLANLALVDFDRTIAIYCEAFGITYTRYCDDLTFSSKEAFDTKALIEFVTDQLKREHYRPNVRKTRVYGKGSRHVVTGIIVNNKRLRVPSEYKHNLRQDLYYIKKYGVTSHLEHKNLPGFGSVFSSPDKRHEDSYIMMLIGRATFASNIDPRDRELKRIRYELYECLDKTSEAYRELFSRYVNFAGFVCQSHILASQEACSFIKAESISWNREGLIVYVNFEPNKAKKKYLFRYITEIIRDGDFPALKSHQVMCRKDAFFSFKLRIYEFSECATVIGNCLDELLIIYSRLKLRGYL